MATRVRTTAAARCTLCPPTRAAGPRGRDTHAHPPRAMGTEWRQGGGSRGWTSTSWGMGWSSVDVGGGMGKSMGANQRLHVAVPRGKPTDGAARPRGP